MRKIFPLFILFPFFSSAQMSWVNVDSAYQPLPAGVHVYYTNTVIEGKPNIAYYLSAELKDKHLLFTDEIGYGKRFTPTEYFQKEEKPLVVVNCTFFEFEHNSNLNLVIKDGKIAAYNNHSNPGRAKDTFTYFHPFGSAIGITKNREADVAWLYTDSSHKYPFAMQSVLKGFRDSLSVLSYAGFRKQLSSANNITAKKWKMQTAVGGGPVLLQDGEIKISNNEEAKFAGKAINDKHPRTSMGYTADGKLIILVIEGRYPGKAEGATLGQEALMLKEIGCKEALNLDGGGSSCMLVNGKQTITPSEKAVQRPVPAVFMIKTK